MLNKHLFIHRYSTLNSLLKQHQQQQQQSASFRIKSHPEDNQGYPEEKNMDYDPDPEECYPDDDSPYEGLIQPPANQQRNKSNNNININIAKQSLVGGTSGGSGESTSGSSSSPILFDSNGIDMPLVSNNYQKPSHYAQTSTHSKTVYSKTSGDGANGAYATILPSANITTPRSSHYGFQNQQQQQSSKYNNYDIAIDPYQQQQQQIQQHHYQHVNYKYQQASPSLNNSNDYGKLSFFVFVL